ncbi:bifunctional DNA primase/polymerase [Mesorhizobium denitrificans]|uniref:bifunctional DNA primase/polymerase n=1 Tax=Mesorhizobium denitrificans TaxID=2294114 RepID=UPI0013148EDB|nr:bifunctional DNA primase/polymerase [Mesorhizobium denitrificans]
MHSTPTKNLPVIEQALEYARNGFPVFPVNPQTNSPLTKNGFYDATTDPAQIKQSWDWTPDAMIGIPTGAVSGVWVLDLDRPKEGNQVDGVEEFEKLLRQYNADPIITHTVVSAHGGRHLYFAYDPAHPIRGWTNLDKKHIDTRGDGNYIIAAGSITSANERYTFEDPFSLYKIATAPDWLYQWIEEARRKPSAVDRQYQQTAQQQMAQPAGTKPATPEYGRKALESEAAKLAGAPTGERHNHTLNSAISMGTIVAAGALTKSEVVSALTDACHTNGHIKDDGDRSVEQTINDGLAYGISKGPRMLPESKFHDETNNTADAARLQKATWVCGSDFAGQDIPPREFLDDRELIPVKAVTQLSGDGAVGKSLLALQTAIAVATDTEWLSKKVKGGSAIYLSAEDDLDEIRRRIAKICEGENIDPNDLKDLHILPLVGKDALLATVRKDGVVKATELFGELARKVAELQAKLVVIDNLSNVFAGNENDRSQATQFISLLDGIALQSRCAVLLLAHPSVSGMNDGTGRSGTTGWGNRVRSKVYFERVKGEKGLEKNEDLRTLTSNKVNYAKQGEVVHMRWENWRFVADGVETSLNKDALAAKADRVFMILLRWYNDNNLSVGPNPGSNYAPSLFAKDDAAEGVTKEQFGKAMKRLLAAGKIAVHENGRKTQRLHITPLKYGEE